MPLNQTIITDVTAVGDGILNDFSFSVNNIPEAEGIPSTISIPNPPVEIIATTLDPVSGVIDIVFARPLKDGETVVLRLVLGYSSVSGSFSGTKPVSGSVSISNFPGLQAVTGPLTDVQLRATPLPVSGTFFPGTQPVSLSAGVAGTPSTDVITVQGIATGTPQPVSGSVTTLEAPATLVVTGTAAVNTGVTVSLPAVAGQFHYITAIQIHKLYAVIGVASGAGVIVTTTNLPGSLAFTTEQLASAAGSCPNVVNLIFNKPLKSSVVNTATTIVCPAQLQTIWRVNVFYTTAA